MGMATGSGRRGVRSDINVTPLVDVVLVLLIIFMVVTPLMSKELEVRTPETSDGTPGAPVQQVVVGIDAAGQLSLDGAPVSEAEYVPRLRQLMEARAPGARLVFFAAEDRASYSRLVAALDGAKLAGAEVLGMVAGEGALSQLENR